MQHFFTLARLFGVASFTISIHASAATFAVGNGNNSGSGSLRQAILDANSSASAPHTINISSTASPIILSAPLPQIERSLSIIAQTHTRVITPRAGFISAGALLGGSLNLTNLDIVADFMSPATSSRGGCINIDSSGNRLPWTVRLTNVELSNCRVESANANAVGGAIYAFGNLTLENSAIRTSSAFAPNGTGAGGAIYQSSGSVTLRRSELSFNAGRTQLGVVYLDPGTSFDAQDSEFHNNELRATNSSGVIYADNNNTITLERVAFANNYGDQGAAILALNANLSIQNASFYRNLSLPGSSFPAAVVLSGSLSMRHSAFFDNTAHLAHVSGSVSGFSGNAFADSRSGACLLQTMPVAALANFGSGGCTAAGFSSANLQIEGYGRVSSTDLIPLLTFSQGSPIFDAYGPTAGQSATNFNQCAQVDARSRVRPVNDDGDGFSECDAGPGESAPPVSLFRDGFE